MLLVIVESPFKGLPRPDTGPWCGCIAAPKAHLVQECTKLYARRCMLDSLERGEAPFLSHLLYTQVWDDMDPAKRSAGIEAGLAWGKVANMTAVYTDLGVSDGMRQGIERATREGRPIVYRSLA